MAKKRKTEGGIYVAKPRPDTYLALLVLTSVLMVVACGIMVYEYMQLQS